jgi:hypothetical protein
VRGLALEVFPRIHNSLLDGYDGVFGIFWYKEFGAHSTEIPFALIWDLA